MNSKTMTEGKTAAGMAAENTINRDSLADIEFQLRWQSTAARHKEVWFTKWNFWRGMLPPGMEAALMGRGKGERVTLNYPATDRLLPGATAISIRRDRFDESRAHPRYGRFYPLGLISGLYGVFPGNIRPFRVKGLDEEVLQVDTGHPLAGYDLEMTAIVHDTMIKPYDRGGECHAALECAADGPGMQARADGRPTDFFSPDAFMREDETDDQGFYEKPRLVNHLDDRAIETITALYGDVLKPGMDVLDLMSSWRSHVPAGAGLRSLTGLGMNAAELEANPQLTKAVLHDLNRQPRLPFEEDAFDAVICTASVEYLIHPEAVFADVARVLRSGGVFAITFSNRWFPPKTIRLWTRLHEFERMGLVLEYFQRSGKFGDLHTLSSRGWPRPEHDKYYGRQFVSDPVYGVWGCKISN